MKREKEVTVVQRVMSYVAIAIVVGIVISPMAGRAGAVRPPGLTITQGPYHNGQRINLSVGPNRYFKPYARIIVIECADPGGRAKNLPINVGACDGNTIQGNTILVQRDGSFSERGYQVYALPNASQLGEASDTRPVCGAKTTCVFYIGQNQEKFSDPKIWSPPFTVAKSGRH